MVPVASPTPSDPVTSPDAHDPDRMVACAPTPQRLRQAVAENYDFLWRSLRRFGVAEEGVDDALQQLFVIASNKLGGVAPGKDRSFLLSVAIRVAANARRSQRRRREVPTERAGESLSVQGSAEDALDELRARELLDDAMLQMSEKLRTVFVLYELEELSMAEIAALLEVPPGTVASRLRLARAEFDTITQRLREQLGSMAP